MLFEYKISIAIVTHLHEMGRMSAPYKLRKWAICMIWANNSEFCFLSNFDALKPGITILRSEMDSTPQYKSEMKYHMIVIIRFFVYLFSKWSLEAILYFTYLKKTLEVSQRPPCRF